MSEVKFKYSKTFREILRGMKDDIAKKLISSEDKKSTNLIDITDKKQFLKCVIDTHVSNMRCGKVIRKIVPNAKTVEVEVFVNKFRSKIFNCTFDIVTGMDIVKYYQKENYYKNPEKDSSLYGSCMTDKNPDVFDIYTKNKVRLIILKDNDTGKLLGRALLWDDVNEQKGVSMMDRPYVAFQALEYKFNDFAEDNNIFNWTDLYYEDLEYKLNTYDLEKFPYCDTFKLLNPDGTLVNKYIDYDTVKDGEVYKEFDRTDGSCTEHKGILYYDNIKDEVGKYTFKWDKIAKCNLDGRHYLKDNILSRGFHKDYLPLWKNRFHHISHLLDFDFENNELMCRLFLITIKEEFGSSYGAKNLLRSGDICDGFSNLHDGYSYQNIKYRVVGKRMREIVFPIKIKKIKYFLKIKLMPSGMKFDVMAVEKKVENIAGYKYKYEVIDKSLYSIQSKSLRDFINNKYFELKSDISRP